MGGYLAYAEYKDSRVKWLGEIPKPLGQSWQRYLVLEDLEAEPLQEERRHGGYDGDVPWINVSTSDTT